MLSNAQREALQMRLQEIDLRLEAPPPQQPPDGPPLDFELDELEQLRREREEIQQKLGRDWRSGVRYRRAA